MDLNKLAPYLGILNSPQVGGMIEGYLAGLQPSKMPITGTGLLGSALRGGREAQEREMARLMQEKEFGLKERGVDIQQQLADLEGSKFKNTLEQQQYARALAEQKRQQQLSALERAFGGGSGQLDLSDDQIQRAGLLAASGNIEGALGVLAEKKEMPPAQMQMKLAQVSAMDKGIQRVRDSIDDLVEFTGGTGKTEKLAQMGLSIFGGESDRYRDYKSAKAAVEFLASQVRAAFGDSVNPRIVEGLRDMINPEGIATSPEAARQQIEDTLDLIEQEGKSYGEQVEGLRRKRKGPKPITMGEIKRTARRRGLTPEQVIQDIRDARPDVIIEGFQDD